PPPSATSNSSFLSSRSKPPPPLSTKPVVTVPPWARDEPPSPTDTIHLAPPSPGGSHNPSEARRSDAISYQSSSGHPTSDHLRWWAFNRTRPRSDTGASDVPPPPPLERKGISVIEQLGRHAWKSSSNSQDETVVEKEAGPSTSHPKDWGLRLSMPTPPPAPFTLAQSHTPGWDSPWTARPANTHLSGIYEQLGNVRNGSVDDKDSGASNLSRWARIKKRGRAYLLHNTYVPLLFRFINITFTTAALAIAIRIRLLESAHGVMGALGSSPTLVVIFAPLTLVHVMMAIYLEYFGKPLGLWKTSGKLAHTLFEVLFVCAWSAAFSLCFDNFFTSLIPCASPSAVSWYSNLPRPDSPIGDIGRGENGLGDLLCDDQVALICLVGIGLLMYCFNLIISLYRIFEKVKIHHAPALPTWTTPLTRK
ncbi:hypothetical protein EVG20_g1943, partial [Dentipellis fragilis]